MLKKTYYAYTLLLPGLLVYTILFLLPSVISFYYAFTNWDASFTVTRHVGLENFITLYQNESNLLAFKNTFIFAAVTTLGKVCFGFLLALLANQAIRSRLLLRSVIFFPVILSTVAVALAFRAIMHPTNGLINVGLRAIGLDALAMSWLTDPSLVIYSIAFVEIWKWTGLSMVLFLAALQSLPREVVEAAHIDGASHLKLFRFITFPMLLPVINMNIILGLIGGLKVFDTVYALTGGGPGNASNVINTLVFRAFAAGRNGEATAANLVLFATVLVAVVLVNKLMNRGGGGGGEE